MKQLLGDEAMQCISSTTVSKLKAVFHGLVFLVQLFDGPNLSCVIWIAQKQLKI